MRSVQPERVLAGLVALAVLAGLGIDGAWQLKQRHDVRRRAIALTGGDPAQGAALVAHYGCGGCHRIPGVSAAQGDVGPPLDHFARRVYIAGVLPNMPANLQAWILDPPAVDPKTAMPKTGASPDDARNLAAFLYTLD